MTFNITCELVDIQQENRLEVQMVTTMGVFNQATSIRQPLMAIWYGTAPMHTKEQARELLQPIVDAFLKSVAPPQHFT